MTKENFKKLSWREIGKLTFHEFECSDDQEIVVSIDPISEIKIKEILGEDWNGLNRSHLYDILIKHRQEYLI